MPKKSKKTQKPRKPAPRKLRKLTRSSGRATLALTERRLQEQSARLDRLHRRRLLLLGIVVAALATYGVGAAIALTQHHLPTAILSVSAAVPLLAVALRTATLAWPPRDPHRLAPDVAETITRTPGIRAVLNAEGAQPPADLPPELTEPELRLSLARWNALAIDTNEANLDRLASDTDRAARWTLATVAAVALALITLGVVRVLRLAIEDEPTRSFFVG